MGHSRKLTQTSTEQSSGGQDNKNLFGTIFFREESMARVVYTNGFFGEIVVAGRVEDKARPVLEDWKPGLAQESEKVMIEDKKTETVSSWSQVVNLSDWIKYQL